jgi:uncharacterized membrane protein
MYAATIKQLAAIGIIMLIMDLTWLNANADYNSQMFARIQGHPIRMRLLPAIITYVLMMLAVWLFVVRETDTWREAGVRGALLGFFIYGVYDGTNYATLTNYTLRFALTDALWGAVLFGVVGAATKALGL